MLNLSDSIFRLSKGYFDPSIKPIIDLWGIGTAEQSVPKQASIDSILPYVGYQKGLHFTILNRGDHILIEKKHQVLNWILMQLLRVIRLIYFLIL